VVPTVFTDVNGHVIQSNQFSVTEHVKGAELGQLQSLPGVFLFYELSPIKVTFTETHVSFLHFLTNVCAIVGGVFTVSGIIDSFVYHGQKAIKKKMEIENAIVHKPIPLPVQRDSMVWTLVIGLLKGQVMKTGDPFHPKSSHLNIMELVLIYVASHTPPLTLNITKAIGGLRLSELLQRDNMSLISARIKYVEE
ncbi:UNVERIFIED_CONTAM: Endoplasmic reticulum-Golgi intermediate compartment protein 3, partial [Sesamum indicum]